MASCRREVGGWAMPPGAPGNIVAVGERLQVKRDCSTWCPCACSPASWLEVAKVNWAGAVLVMGLTS